MGVIAFFTEMKMRHAVILLQSGKRVGETALELGYTDQNYFSTVFHRVMGTSPGVFRVQQENKQPIKNTIPRLKRKKAL
jgi:AraC-like DNA-binding protein